MPHLTSLKRTEDDRRAEAKAGGFASISPATDDKGEPEIHLDQHHLKKLGVDSPLPVGHEIRLRARGVVTGSHSSASEHGKHHSMRVKLTHATLKHDAEDEAEDRKADIGNAVAKYEARK